MAVLLSGSHMLTRAECDGVVAFEQQLALVWHIQQPVQIDQYGLAAAWRTRRAEVPGYEISIYPVQSSNPLASAIRRGG